MTGLNAARQSRRRKACSPIPAIIALTLLLGGCASSGDWVKPGADLAAAAAALRECRAVAETAVEPEIHIDEDIQATRQTDWQRAQIGQIASQSLGDETRRRDQRIVDSCMQAQGFAHPK